MLFGLDGQTAARDVEKMLFEAGAPPAAHLRLNGTQKVAFVRFATEESCAATWRLAHAKRLAIGGRVLRAECKEAALQLQLSLEHVSIALPYEDPTARFVPLLFAARQKPFPLLRPPSRVPEKDRTVFVNAWKTLLLAEACCQIELADKDKAPHHEVEEAVPGASKKKITFTLMKQKGKEELVVCDAVLWKGAVGVVEESRGSRVTVVFETTPDATTTETSRKLVVLASLLTSRRAYEALNWFHLADLAGNTVAQALFQGRSSVYSPLAAPRPPAHLNDAQGRVVSRFALLEEGVLLCQGPPGTGKTTLAVAAIESVASPKVKVAVCAPSNKAVHEILVRFRAANPLFPVLLLGNNTRRTLPPEAAQVFCDTFCVDKAAVLSEAAKRNDGETAGSVCALLKQWALPVPHAAVAKQCDRVTKGLCWACGKQDCCSGEWSDKSNALHALLSSMRAADYRRHLIANARVLFMTLSTFGRGFVRESLPPLDVLLVDEAAQASEPELLIAMYTRAKKALLIGDPKQLPSTVFSRDAYEHGYGVSTMERLMASGAEAMLLDQQYRMPAGLRQWPSDTFYGGKITDHASLATRAAPWAEESPLPSLLPAGCRALIKCEGKEEHAGSDTSFLNRREAEEAARLVDELRKRHADSVSVGVITFYAGQKSLIESLVASDCLVSTVDGFQGGERDVIVVSFVRTRPNKSRFLNDAKRLNVALTRAKHYLVLLCSAESGGSGLMTNLLQSFR